MARRHPERVDNDENLSSGEDTNSLTKNIVIGLSLAALYFAGQAWISEVTFYLSALTVMLLYNVIALFKNHWGKVKFWVAVAVLFAVHVALFAHVNVEAIHWNFWKLVEVGAPEGLAMILILGWILGDNYFTRNSRIGRRSVKAPN